MWHPEGFLEEVQSLNQPGENLGANAQRVGQAGRGPWTRPQASLLLSLCGLAGLGVGTYTECPRLGFLLTGGAWGGAGTQDWPWAGRGSGLTWWS